MVTNIIKIYTTVFEDIKYLFFLGKLNHKNLTRMDRAELGKQFLNQFQSTLFFSKLEDGSATEKADLLRRTMMELKVANNVNL